MDLGRMEPKKWEGGRDYTLPAAKFAFFVISHHNGCAIDHSLHPHSGHGPS